MIRYYKDSNNRIDELFPFVKEPGHVVSIVGAGGKTSIMYDLARAASSGNMRVVVTTTTHILDPRTDENLSRLYAGNEADVRALWEQGLFAVVGTEVSGSCKLGPDWDFLGGCGVWKEIRESADLVIIEADGSRHKPCKVPAEHEPVITDDTDTVIGVAGGNAVGHRVCDTCFRPEDVAGFLGCDERHVIDEEDLKLILKSDKGTAKNTCGRNYYPVISYAGERLVVIRGGGDLATGVASELHIQGFRVLMLDIEKPAAIRRKVAFSEAVYDGSATVEDFTARRISSLDELECVWAAGEIPILVDPEGKCIPELRPDVVVDAIIAKKNLGTHRSMAPLTIGMGPGFCASDDVDYVIETMRGETLGQVISEGCSLPNTGVPGVIAGHSADRVIHSPAQGTIHPCVEFGEIVEIGQEVAVIDTDTGRVSVPASMSGFIHGMIRDGYVVPRGFKIADIDPRTDHPEIAWRISDKARKLGRSISELITSRVYR